MLCEECGRQEAQVVLTTVVNGVSSSRHLCRDCVKKYQTGDIQGVLATVLAAMVKKEKTPDLVCPDCGETYAEFQKSGRLGCAACYTAFRSELTPLLSRIQGKTRHTGRRPPVSEQEQSRLNEIARLRARMEQAVTEENFEEAAVLRDQLRAMTNAREENA